LLFLGDSIAAGLGAGGEPFPIVLEALLRADGIAVEVNNASINGGRVSSHVERLAGYRLFRPDVVVLHVGSVDAIPIPKRNSGIDLIKFLPARYQQPGWLQPRPYFPRRWWKRIFYAIPESYLRTALNRTIMRVQGSTNVPTTEQFRADLDELVSAFVGEGASCIVCGLGPIDDAKFPGAADAFRRYDAIVRAAAEEKSCEYVEIARVFHGARHHRDGLLLLDNFHPNAQGHQAIAQAILPSLRRALADNKSR
jgi:lysophospholipase L1-like esterase